MGNNWKDTGDRMRVAGINAAIAIKNLSWAFEDMIEKEVEKDAEKAVKSVKKYIRK